MKLIKQPNAWTCSPTSLAMLANTTPEHIMQLIGHDGSESVPENPFGRRCFYDLEIVYAAYRLDIWLVPFALRLAIPGKEIKVIDTTTFVQLLERHPGLLMSVGVDSGRGHTVAWDGSRVLDPRTPERVELQHFNERYNVEVFYAWMQ